MMLKDETTELIKEIPFGEARARISVYGTKEFDLGGEYRTHAKISIYKEGKLQAVEREFGLVTDKEVLKSSGVSSLDSPYTYVGRFLTEGRETYDSINEIVDEMNAELGLESIHEKRERWKELGNKVDLKLIKKMLVQRDISHYHISKATDIPTKLLNLYGKESKSSIPEIEIEYIDTDFAITLTEFARNFFSKKEEEPKEKFNSKVVVEILGSVDVINTYWDYKEIIRFCNSILDAVSEPFIYQKNNMSNPIYWDLVNGNNRHNTITDFLFSINEKTESNFESMKKLVVIDELKTKRLNEKYKDIFNYSMTLLPEIVELVIKKVEEDIKNIEYLYSEQVKIDNIKNEEKEREFELRKSLYNIKEIYEKSNYYMDADIINNETNQVIRMVLSNIFDVGTIVRPKRLVGKPLDSKETEEEASAGKWMLEFSGISTSIRM